MQQKASMFIAHLPAGYLLTKSLAPAKSRALLVLGLAGSLFPDLDLLRNFLIDERRVHHHRYWTHLPAYWLAITAIVILVCLVWRNPRARVVALVFLPNVWLHLVLDSWVGHIAWAWPIDDRFFAVVEVPRRYSWYVWSFVFHWTFVLEIAITLAAALRLTVSRARLDQLKRRMAFLRGMRASP